MSVEITDKFIVSVLELAGFVCPHWIEDGGYVPDNQRFEGRLPLKVVGFVDFTVTHDDVRRGVDLAMKNGYRSSIIYGRNRDGELIDGHSADAIMQFAVFGEIVYD